MEIFHYCIVLKFKCSFRSLQMEFFYTQLIANSFAQLVRVAMHHRLFSRRDLIGCSAILLHAKAV